MSEGELQLVLRRGADRGLAEHGWLKSYHSFSFASYYDPAHMNFGELRVINEDRVDAGAGFPSHGHRDMEIVSYVLDGELSHEDSMGNKGIIRPGMVQRMSAGSGVTHSEYNHAADKETHFLQIWLTPAVRGLRPSYEDAEFSPASKKGTLRVVASPDGVDGSVTIHTNARILSGTFGEGDEGVSVALSPGRKAYVHLIRGRLSVNGVVLEGGDALKVTAPRGSFVTLDVGKGADAEVLVFDVTA